MQCNVECRLPEEDVILKEPPPLGCPWNRSNFMYFTSISDCCTYVQAAIIKGSARKATFEFKTYKYDQIDSLLQGLYIKKE